jgi:hypothetical protein
MYPKNTNRVQKEYYKNKIIQLETEAKKTITLDTEKILSFDNMLELGEYVYHTTNKKIKECDDHIEKIKLS